MAQIRALIDVPSSLVILMLHAALTGAQSTTEPESSLATHTTTHSTLHTTTHNSSSVSHLTGLPTLPSETPIPSSLSASIPSTIPASNGNYANGDPDDGPSSESHSTLLNLYFFFLILVAVLAALAIWLIYRRRSRKMEALRSSRRDALERDLSSTVEGRSGFFGPIDGERWRSRRRWLTAFTFPAAARGPSNNVEGLDAAGHAPPPYKAQSQETITAVNVDTGHKPPEYHEVTLGETSSDGSSVEEAHSQRRPSAGSRRGST